ncbi:MAG: prolipoprotein diacylglyceryl transferase [Myxococcales bacterium]|nr:prolipoprotein diacylglyceryl transferase [Myxococcales bacterium]
MVAAVAMRVRSVVLHTATMTLALIPWFKLEPWHLPLPLLDRFPIQPFGVLAATAILLGIRFAGWRAERTGVPRKLVGDFLLHVVVVGLAACMVFNLVVYEPAKIPQMARAIGSWFGLAEATAFPYPGLSSFGGFAGGTLAAFWFARRRQVPILVLSGIFCFTIPFAWIFARMGCFVVHDHPGIETDFFLAVDNYYGQGVARHDLGLYEVLWSLFMTPLVLWLDRTPRPLGFFTALVPIAYASVRFFLDYLREIPVHGGDIRSGSPAR